MVYLSRYEDLGKHSVEKHRRVLVAIRLKSGVFFLKCGSITYWLDRLTNIQAHTDRPNDRQTVRQK